MSRSRPAVGGYRVRPATLGDIPTLAYQRCAMFVATGAIDRDATAELDAAERRYLAQAMPAGTFVAWLVEHQGQIVAGGGLQLRTLQPRPGFVRGEPEGLVVSMWTEPSHRRRGLGSLVLDAILQWCRARRIRRLTLHASDEGRPLYERFGFRPTNEMRLELAPSDAPVGEARGQS
jgi:GNAT superfamily N-acetyltransferase